MGTATLDGAVAYQGIEPPLARIRQETESNQQAFLRQGDSCARHEGAYALMKSGIIIGFYPTSSSAMLVGYERCLDRVFSIHRVRGQKVRRPTDFFRSLYDQA